MVNGSPQSPSSRAAVADIERRSAVPARASLDQIASESRIGEDKAAADAVDRPPPPAATLAPIPPVYDRGSPFDPAPVVPEHAIIDAENACIVKDGATSRCIFARSPNQAVGKGEIVDRTANAARDLQKAKVGRGSGTALQGGAVAIDRQIRSATFQVIVNDGQSIWAAGQIINRGQRIGATGC